MAVQDPLDFETTLKIQPAVRKRRPMKLARYEEYLLEIDELKGKDKGKGRKEAREEEDTLDDDAEESNPDQDSFPSLRPDSVASGSANSRDSSNSNASVQYRGPLGQFETDQHNKAIIKDAVRLGKTLDIGLEPFKKHFRKMGLIAQEDYN